MTSGPGSILVNGVTHSNPLFFDKPAFEVNFPQRDEDANIQQDAEFFDITLKQRIRIHDYDTIYIIEQTLQCKSPQQLVALLCETLNSRDPNIPKHPLRILDVAAGNGRLGAEIRDRLSKQRIERLVGTDISGFASLATTRERGQDLYDEYIITNLLEKPHSEVLAQWKAIGFHVVTICAALGPGKTDLPLEVIDAAIELLQDGGLLVFTVNTRVGGKMRDRYKEFLGSLVQGSKKTHWKAMKEVGRKVYEHRLNVKMESIEYTALIYQKMGATEMGE